MKRWLPLSAAILLFGTLSWASLLQPVQSGGAWVATATSALDMATYYIGFGSDPAEAGDLRLGNNEAIAWEASPAGTDVSMTVNSSEAVVFAGLSALTVPTTATIGFAASSSLACASNGACALTNNAGTSPSYLLRSDLVTARTTDLTLVSTDSGTTYTNTGAGGQVILTLPASAVGLWFEFSDKASQNLRILAVGSDTIRSAATVSGAAGHIDSATIGDSLILKCVAANKWVVFSLMGGGWSVT